MAVLERLVHVCKWNQVVTESLWWCRVIIQHEITKWACENQ